MKILRILSLALVVLNSVAFLLFAAKPNVDKQLLSMTTTAVLLLLLFLGSFVAGFFLFSRLKFRAFVPAAICFVGLPLGVLFALQAGHSFRSWYFQKHLPRYQEVVRLIEAGEIKRRSADSYAVDLPPQYADLALVTWVRTNSERAIIVEFITGGGFPVRHSG